MKQVDKKGKNNNIGAIGELIAAKYLEKLGLKVIDRNYLKKWGELDIVARATNTIHFIEVKAVSYETKEQLKQSVSYGTWRPEENVHHKKIKRMNRAIETWLIERNLDLDWQIDVIAVRTVPRERYAVIKYIPNVILD